MCVFLSLLMSEFDKMHFMYFLHKEYVHWNVQCTCEEKQALHLPNLNYYYNLVLKSTSLEINEKNNKEKGRKIENKIHLRIFCDRIVSFNISFHLYLMITNRLLV